MYRLTDFLCCSLLLGADAASRPLLDTGRYFRLQARLIDAQFPNGGDADHRVAAAGANYLALTYQVTWIYFASLRVKRCDVGRGW